MSDVPDRFDNQQDNPDAQDRDRDVSYRQNAPKARPTQDNAFDRPGSVDRSGGEVARRSAESFKADAADQDQDR